MERVSVPLAGGRSYDIHIGSGWLDSFSAQALRSRRAVVFVDSRVANRNPVWFARFVSGAMPGDAEVDLITVRTAEQRKNLASVESLLKHLHRLDRIDRSTVLVAIGGGVLGDMVGFAASIWLRGLRFVQVPTTLLAMVDSSVGGKTGVDFEDGKNLVGAFHQPESVWIDPVVLQGLPVGEFRSGMAEVVKYGFIRDPSILEVLEAWTPQACRKDPSLAVPMVARSCAIKAAVVGADEREESGLRAILNYGHTIGHALEGATGYRRFRHGEAVAIGMVSAAAISAVMGLADSDLVERTVDTLHRIGLPTSLPADVSDSELVRVAWKDKKSSAGSLRFVLARTPGDVRLMPVEETTVREGLALHRSLSSGASQ